MGATLAETFESGALGLLELMVNTADVTPSTSVEFPCEADDVGTLFVIFLNEILFARDQQGMFFRHAKVLEMAARDGLHTLRGAAWGSRSIFASTVRGLRSKRPHTADYVMG